MAEQARRGKVTVVGAGFYGSTTALRLAEYDVFETVVLTDIVEGKPEGLALDLNQSRPIEGFETKVVGVGVGLAMIALEHWRRGLLVIGLVLVVAALLRLLLPLPRLGFLAVRSRTIDVTLTGGAGLTIAVIALTLPGS